MDVLWGIIFFLIGIGLVIYFTNKFGKLHSKDFVYALLGGLGFSVTWMMISLLLDTSPKFIFPIAGGIAVFLGFLLIKAITKSKDRE